MRTIGLDVGDRRVGVAISDPEGRLAVPLRVIDRKGRDQEALRDIVALTVREEAERIVVGLPVSFDGSLGAQAQASAEYAERLRAALEGHADVVLYDERLSSAEADRHFQAMGMSTREMKQRRDASAAAIILQSYLDSRRAPPLPPIE